MAQAKKVGKKAPAMSTKADVLAELHRHRRSPQIVDARVKSGIAEREVQQMTARNLAKKAARP